ncbi:MAG: NAD(P)H-hydrate dehydratase [Clostridia bacterium]|nr:NAD(P)H-hydrate dehydratase [Clostridia bacterium]
MKYVTGASESRELDKFLIEKSHIPGVVLMENAAMAVTQQVMQHEGSVLVLCGMGNNGGDGFCVLRQLAVQGRDVCAVLLGDSEKIQGDALVEYNAAKGSGLSVLQVECKDDFERLISEKRFSVVVDAIFGTGLCRDVEGLYAEVIECVNSMSAVKIAIDIPSGISADTGRILNAAVKAHKTITFQTAKRGHMLFPGREYTGDLSVAPIGITDNTGCDFTLEKSDVLGMLPERRADSHKSTYGKLLIIGGSDEYAGACIMASLAALRSGAGLIKVMSTKRVTDELLHVAPEIMSFTVEKMRVEIARPLIDWCDVMAVGMGMGQAYGVAEILDAALSSGKTLLIDADGINVLAKHPKLMVKLHDRCILTPHVGEFSRLTGKSLDAILANFTDEARFFSQHYGVNLILKNSTSVIANPQGICCYNITGNSSLAKGGSGDTLSGLIASLCAQGMSAFDAACAGAYIQGKTAESMPFSERTVTPTDISREYSQIFQND